MEHVYKEVPLGPGDHERIPFIIKPSDVGEYSVQLGTLRNKFNVSEEPPLKITTPAPGTEILKHGEFFLLWEWGGNTSDWFGIDHKKPEGDWYTEREIATGVSSPIWACRLDTLGRNDFRLRAYDPTTKEQFAEAYTWVNVVHRNLVVDGWSYTPPQPVIYYDSYGYLVMSVRYTAMNNSDSGQHRSNIRWYGRKTAPSRSSFAGIPWNVSLQPGDSWYRDGVAANERVGVYHGDTGCFWIEDGVGSRSEVVYFVV